MSLFIYLFIYFIYIYILVAPSGKLLVSSLVEQDVQERLSINAWFTKSCFHVNWQSIGVCVMYTSLIEKGAVATILMLSMWEIACTKIIFFLDAARRFRSCDQSSHCRSTTLQVAVLVLSFFLAVVLASTMDAEAIFHKEPAYKEAWPSPGLLSGQG